MRTFKNLEEIIKTWKKFGKSEWKPCIKATGGGNVFYKLILLY